MFSTFSIPQLCAHLKIPRLLVRVGVLVDEININMNEAKSFPTIQSESNIQSHAIPRSINVNPLVEDTPSLECSECSDHQLPIAEGPE